MQKIVSWLRQGNKDIVKFRLRVNKTYCKKKTKNNNYYLKIREKPFSNILKLKFFFAVQFDKYVKQISKTK